VIPTRLFLTPLQVGEKHNLSRQTVVRLLLADRIWPAYKTGGRWLIAPTYIITTGPINKMGRPKGAKGKYPKGTKRPNRRKRVVDETPTQQ